ncbi:hypothetical protein [Nocardia puris]|uniref:hypothetical protein n=1 Tax=Nocardia puris TaxID=208602 RepID=UPI002E1EFDB9
MRPTAAGTILDSSALIALPRSIFAQTVLSFSVRERRPLVIPATSLYTAVLAGADPEDFDADGFTVVPLSQPIVPGVALVAQTAHAPIGADTAQVVWEAQVTGYPVLTDNPDQYAAVTVPIDLEVI